MKLPFILGGGGGSSYHCYSDGPHDDDFDTESTEDFGSESAEHTFDEYMWMVNEEEFDKIEMQRLDEEELIRQCLEHAQDDDDDVAYNEHLHVWVDQYESTDMANTFENSTLNPLAKEFIPSAAKH